ncbi:MAG: helix-turn-helix transcriptional regulator [Oscillospiraceae bacterium]|mgnify:CR=1 FL=1|jgi:AraC-like DNA-binding protein|nr:helix-turn-helix transcriptional regulator [Oscillospiraceae bacterium]MCI1990841.1 helix-turn-helix transcriptional regulator [Oscillospiraceae bacterium]MCI2035104.1 helix-turn-helix transcriptional regulator [Oscillospiraceae bacterium]
MESKGVCRPLVPRQPLLVLAATRYYKFEFLRYGISHFYAFQANSACMNMAQLVPDGTIDILFQTGTSFPKVFCYGTPLKTYLLSEYRPMDVKPGDCFFGVRFFPGQAYLFGKMPEAELTEGAVDLHDIIQDQKTIEEISKSSNFQNQIRIFLEAYLKNFRKNFEERSRERRLQDYLTERIVGSRGTVRLDELSEETGYSARYLQRVFRSEKGMSPEQFKQVTRFQNVLTDLRQPSTLTDVAMKAGFFDQSHMIKEFEKILGMSPKRYMRELMKTDFQDRLVVLTRASLEREDVFTVNS